MILNYSQSLHFCDLFFFSLLKSLFVLIQKSIIIKFNKNQFRWKGRSFMGSKRWAREKRESNNDKRRVHESSLIQINWINIIHKFVPLVDIYSANCLPLLPLEWFCWIFRDYWIWENFQFFPETIKFSSSFRFQNRSKLSTLVVDLWMLNWNDVRGTVCDNFAAFIFE